MSYLNNTSEVLQLNLLNKIYGEKHILCDVIIQTDFLMPETQQSIIQVHVVVILIIQSFYFLNVLVEL